MKIQYTALKRALSFVLALTLSLSWLSGTAFARGSYSDLKSDIEAGAGSLTIDISNNISFDDVIEIQAGQDITIDGNGYTLTSALTRHFKVYGELTLENVTLSGAGSGGVYVGGDGKLILQSATIKSCKASGGGAIYADSGAYVQLSEAAITDNRAEESGGGIYAGAGAAIELTGSEITGNTANGGNGAGGGIILHPGAALTMNGGSIGDNTASGDGGGVYAVKDNTVTLTGGAKITGNKAGGSGRNYHGAGIHVNDGGDLRLDNAGVTGNTGAWNGGGVSLYGSGLTIKGGEVSGNTAAYGGGVYVAWSGRAEIIGGGSVTGNWATYDGGGIFTEQATYLNSSYAYGNLSTADDTVFDGNNADSSYPFSGTPYANIQSASVSAEGYVLNNYDINSRAENPEPTSTPTEPEPTVTAEDTPGASPKTGDAGNMALFITILCISLAGIICLLVARRKKQYKAKH